LQHRRKKDRQTRQKDGKPTKNLIPKTKNKTGFLTTSTPNVRQGGKPKEEEAATEEEFVTKECLFVYSCERAMSTLLHVTRSEQ
jgi:hypothetical protein